MYPRHNGYSSGLGGLVGWILGLNGSVGMAEEQQIHQTGGLGFLSQITLIGL